MTLNKMTAAFVFLLLGATSLKADCGYENFASQFSRVKVVTTPASSGTVELLTVPRGSREPWPYDSYTVRVTIRDAETCLPQPAARVWYKDNIGSNHDLSANAINGVKDAIWQGRVGRPQFGVFRLRAWRSGTRPLTFVIHYSPATALPSLPTPQTQVEPPSPKTIERTQSSAAMLGIRLRNQASTSVTFEITDVVCGSSTVIEFAPWEERALRICSDSVYGKIIYRDVRNQSGVEASLLSEGDRVNM